MKCLNINDESLVHPLIANQLEFNAPETIDIELVEKVYLKLLRIVDVKVAMQLSESFIKIRDYFEATTINVPETLHKFLYDNNLMSYDVFTTNVQEELVDLSTHLDFQSLSDLSKELLKFEQSLQQYPREFLLKSILVRK